MAKVSTLTNYDESNASLEDFVPVVQGGVTKRITFSAIYEVNENILQVASSLGPNLSRAEIESTLTANGIALPLIANARFYIRDTGGRFWLVKYDLTNDEFWSTKMDLAA